MKNLVKIVFLISVVDITISFYINCIIFQNDKQAYITISETEIAAESQIITNNEIEVNYDPQFL